MKWIDSTDLRDWTNRRDCQEMLPLLVRKLIRATSTSIQNIRFPAGESVLLGGWDGLLTISAETEYLPIGVSLWEFGANKDIKRKADDDYAKRTDNPLGFNPSESIFIFVTPRLWQNREEWISEKKKDSIWKDIRVLSAETLEEWSSGIKIQLNEKILIGGREIEKKQIIEAVKIPSLIAVQGISREEALAFIISCFKNNQESEEDFFSRSIIVDNPNTFRALSIHDKPLILIPRFEDNGVINRAINKGHTVIIPLGADSLENWSDKIILPRLNRDSFVYALEETGMTREFAERYSKESARNITILRRQLEFARTIPEWASFQNVSEIIPALIVGRWDESYEDDKNIIAQFANDSYENYTKRLIKWCYAQDSPIIKIGNTWRLTSPFDSWSNASKYVTQNDFELLHQVSINILSEVDTAFELLPEQRYIAFAYAKKRRFSSWIRKGIVQSLILTSIFGEKLKLNLPVKAELWVDNIIIELLKTGNAEIWKSLENDLPLIAEASPTAFFDSIEKHLSSEESPIVSLFDEEPGLIIAKTYHTGLLWALESLAWFPKYLYRASLILARLSAIDPGGTLSNRPLNNLSEIFKSWHPQTLASLEERMQVLSLIAQKIPEITWTILIHLLPSGYEIAQNTYKTRWRMFELETEKSISYNEIYQTHSKVVDLLLSVFDFTETKLAKLIDESDKLSKSDRDKIFSFAENVIPHVKHLQHEVWHTCRKTLHSHRSCSDAKWALPEVELSKYEQLYKLLEPTDVFDKTIWMFNDYFPQFSIGYKYSRVSDEAHEDFIQQERIKALTQIYQEYGLTKIIELMPIVKKTGILGDTLGFVVNSEEEIILALLN